MATLILDSELEKDIIELRRERGIDQFDEVWDGVYVIQSPRDLQFHDVRVELLMILNECFTKAGLGRAVLGGNISDRATDWSQNYRVPPLIVFDQDRLAENRDTHWFGGPEFVVEIECPGDRTFEKLPFYAAVNSKEVLIIKRDPWELALFRNQFGSMVASGRSTAGNASIVASEVVPLSFQLLFDAAAKPRIEVRHHDGQQQWTIATKK